MHEQTAITDSLNWQNADFKYLKLLLKSQRKRNLQQELQIRRGNLETLSLVLKDCGIPFWIQGKTLLGAIRDKQFIIDDHDDDIGIFSEHQQCVCSNVYTKLKEQGFQAIRCGDTMLSIIRNNRYIDICFFKKSENKIGYDEKWFPKEFFNEFDTVQFYGKYYSVPSNADDLLTIMYPIQPDKSNILTTIYKPIKKIKRKIKRAGKRFKAKLFQKKIITKMTFERFICCKIEADTAKNWVLRGPHLDLITDNGKIRKIGDIIKYFKSNSKLDYIKNNFVVETETSEPFEEPINLNSEFWQTGNNYLFYCIYYGFRKNIASYSELLSRLSVSFTVFSILPLNVKPQFLKRIFETS